jgi:hypothetical protein
MARWFRFEAVQWWTGKLVTLTRIHVFTCLSIGVGVYFFGFSQAARELWEDVLDPVRPGALLTTLIAAFAWIWALAWTTQHVHATFVGAVRRRHDVQWPECQKEKRRAALLRIVDNLPPLAVVIAVVALLFGAITSEISQRDKLAPLAVFATFAACTSGLIAQWRWRKSAPDRTSLWLRWLAFQGIAALLIFSLLSMVVPDRLRTGGDIALRLVPTAIPFLCSVLASSWMWANRTRPGPWRFVAHALVRWLIGCGIVFAWWGLPLRACYSLRLLGLPQSGAPVGGCRPEIDYGDELLSLAAMAIWVPTVSLALEWLYLAIREITGANAPPMLRAAEAMLRWQARIGPARALLPVLFGGIAFALWPVYVGNALGALAVALLALASWTILCVVVFIVTPIRLGFGALPLLMPLWLFLVSPWTDNHAVDTAEISSETKTPDGPAPRFGQRIDLEFEEWVRSPARSARSSAPVVVVAASGGGVRAAFWTAVVLARLDDRTCGEFGRQVFAISAVSGGSIGAAVYAAARQHARDGAPAGNTACASPETDDDGRVGPVEQLVRRTFDQDLLAPLLGSMLFPDALQRFFPAAWVPWGDRARAIERALEQGWARASGGSNTLGQPLESLYRSDLRRELPLLVFNSTNVGDGRRVVASPALLDDTLAYDLFAQRLATRGMRLSTAALNSARFPAVSPPGSVRDVDGRPALRIVDGGYFENSAAATATALYRTLQRRSVARHRPIALVLIENDPGLDEPSVTCGLEGEILADRYGRKNLRQHLPRQAAPSPEASPIVSEVALELTAISGALLNARTARAPWHQRELAELVCADPDNVLRGFFYRDGIPSGTPSSPDPALSWALSATTRGHMVQRGQGLVQQALQGRFARW